MSFPATPKDWLTVAAVPYGVPPDMYSAGQCCDDTSLVDAMLGAGLRWTGLCAKDCG